jgi:hypothetical protein
MVGVSESGKIEPRFGRQSNKRMLFLLVIIWRKLETRHFHQRNSSQDDKWCIELTLSLDSMQEPGIHQSKKLQVENLELSEENYGENPN